MTQPDDQYIKKLTSNINQEWLASLANNVVAENLLLDSLKVYGFQNISEDVRKHTFFTYPRILGH